MLRSTCGSNKCGLLTRKQYIQPGADQKSQCVNRHRFEAGSKQLRSKSGQYRAGVSARNHKRGKQSGGQNTQAKVTQRTIRNVSQGKTRHHTEPRMLST